MLYVFRSVLVLIIAGNCVGLGVILLAGRELQQAFELFQPWMIPVLAVLAVASIVAGLALWRWQTWGFVLLIASYALMFAINIRIGAPLAHLLLGPAGLILLGVTYWPVRERFSARS